MSKEVLASRYTDLDSCIRCIGSATMTVICDAAHTVTENLTVPSNVSLDVRFGATITISASRTLTINGPFKAGLYSIFSGGTVVFGLGSVTEVYPQWWGALGDGSHDDTAAITAAITSHYNTVLPSVTVGYKITSALTLGAGKMLDGLTVGTIITQYTDNTPIIKITGMQYELKNLVLEYATQQTASDTSAHAIQLGDTGLGAYEGKIQNISIKTPYQGIWISTATGAFAYENRIEGVRVYNAANWGMHLAGNGTIGLTTNTLLNCFVVQDAVSPTTTGAGFYVANHDEIVFINCACDRAPVGYAFVISNCAHAVLIGPHGEYNALVDYGALIKIEDSNAFISGANFIETIMNVANEAYVVLVNGTGRGIVEISGMTERNTTYTAGTLYAIAATTTSAAATIYARGVATSYNNYDALLSGLPIIKEFNNTCPGSLESISGYQLQANGTLIQWGAAAGAQNIAAGASYDFTITFPVEFNTAVWRATPIVVSINGEPASGVMTASSTTGLTFRVKNIGSGAGDFNVNYMVTGN